MTEKSVLIQDWLQRVRKAEEVLRIFRSYLIGWSYYPNVVNDELFMSVIEEMAQAGLFEFVDGGNLDVLRAVLTGLEPPFVTETVYPPPKNE